MAQEPELPRILSDEEFDELLKQRAQFDRLEHQRWDNAGIRARPKPTDGLPESTLEQKFPHIAQKLTKIWLTEACSEFIHNMVISDRDDREGFPVEVIEDFIMLYEINEMILGKNSAGPPRLPKYSGPNRNKR